MPGPVPGTVVGVVVAGVTVVVAGFVVVTGVVVVDGFVVTGVSVTTVVVAGGAVVDSEPLLAAADGTMTTRPTSAATMAMDRFTVVLPKLVVLSSQ